MYIPSLLTCVVREGGRDEHKKIPPFAYASLLTCRRSLLTYRRSLLTYRRSLFMCIYVSGDIYLRAAETSAKMHVLCVCFHVHIRLFSNVILILSYVYTFLDKHFRAAETNTKIIVRIHVSFDMLYVSFHVYIRLF